MENVTAYYFLLETVINYQLHESSHNIATTLRPSMKEFKKYFISA